MKTVFEMLKDSFTAWSQDKAILYAAALAYYTIFSIAPLLVIAISIAGLVFGEASAQKEVFQEIENMVGAQGADAIKGFISNSSKPSGNIIAIIIGVVVMLLGSSMVFNQLQEALNLIWEVPPEESGGLKKLIMKKVRGVLMVFGVGVLLLVVLVINTAISMIQTFMTNIEGMPNISSVWNVVNLVVFLGLLTLIFALVFKILPDVKIMWKDVWIGAAVTALLFNIGKYLIVFYLTHSSPGSTYGAAGSLVVLLLWVYYSAQIFLFGVEFTKVYARRYGSLKATDAATAT